MLAVSAMGIEIIFVFFTLFSLLSVGVIFSLYRQNKNLVNDIVLLQKENKSLKKSVFINPNPVIKINKKGVCTFANQGSEAILTEWQTSLNKKIPNLWFEVMQQIMLSERIQNIEIPCEQRTYLATIVPEKQEGVSIFATDISSIRSFENKLEQHSENDEQTNLPNQVYFRRRLEKASKYSSSDVKTNTAILIVRFDDYSQIVYTYGQKIANQILVTLSQRLKTIVDEDDTIARLSESEFGIINNKVNVENAAQMFLEPIIQTCTIPYQVEENELYISVSVGITFCPLDADTPEMLARNAQLALNRAISSTQNYAFFQRGMEEQLIKKREMTADLHKAVKEKQFSLAYQPQISLKSKKLIGCEALIRWNHPEKGFISPFFFIPVAEESKLILDIGEWVLLETCRQIVLWRDAGYEPIKVAVNLSAQQILESNLVEDIKKITDQHKITPEWLSFELTESALVEDKEKAAAVMNDLRHLGFELSIDDFGTGYSSLSYLVQFAIDKIKIDRSFVIEIKTETEGSAVTKGIIDLIQNMKLKSVAEGVESSSQLQFLNQWGCDIIQGYIFGKPEPAETFENFFRVNWSNEIGKALGNNPIKVGILHSFTGTMAISEQSVANGSLLAIEEINNNGGILGRPIEPILADGASKSEIFAQEAEKLIKEHQVSAIFGLWNSNSRKVVKAIVEKHNHLLFYPLVYEGLEQSENVVYTGGVPNQIVMPTIKWAFENLGQKFFLVASDYIGPHASSKIVSDQIKAMGGEVVGDEYVLFGSHDFESVIDKISSAKPDVIINYLNGDGNVHFLKGLRAKNITPDKIPTISFNFAEAELKNFEPSEVEGDYAAWNYFHSIASELNQQFIEKYRKRYGKTIVTSDPIEAAYYTIYLWAQAVKMRALMILIWSERP